MLALLNLPEISLALDPEGSFGQCRDVSVYGDVSYKDEDCLVCNTDFQQVRSYCNYYGPF